MKNSIWLTLLLVVLIMAAIFGFSSKEAEESDEQSDVITDVVIDIVVPEYEEMIPPEQEKIHDTVSYYVRKTAHALEYSALGFALYLHVSAIGRKKHVPAGFVICFFLGVLYAVSDEWHQSFVAGRHAAAADVLVDSIGVIFGILVLSLILLIIRKKRADETGKNANF